MSKIYRIPHFQIDLGQPDYHVYIKPWNLFSQNPTVRFTRFNLEEPNYLAMPLSKLSEFRTALYEVENALTVAIEDRLERMNRQEDD